MPSKTPEFGRFAEPSLLILVSLTDGPKHGYAIMQDVEQGTGRPMGAGTLYAALARLEGRPGRRRSRNRPWGRASRVNPNAPVCDARTGPAGLSGPGVDVRGSVARPGS
jgi:hypothetical protein